MVDEVVGNIITDPRGAYLDLTVGAGGHLRAIGAALTEDARLYGVDRDPEAIAKTRENLSGVRQAMTLACGSYSSVDAITEQFADKAFDGILLDLGISSLQLDDSRRGFSFRFDGPLDMRFDVEATDLTAADLIATASEKRLTEIIREFGEEKAAGRLAGAIVRERQKKMILTTMQLADVVRSVVKAPHQNKSLARVFQAFRIFVNQELEHLDQVLPKTVNLLRTGGRLVVISYHSLEDRRVKRFFQQQAKGCVCPDVFPVCRCGQLPTVKIITRKSLTPHPDELESNPRARSARIRVAERIAA